MNEYQVFRRLRLATSRFLRAAAMSGRWSTASTSAARPKGVSREPVDVHLRRDARLLRNPERQPERLARLAQRLVAVDQRDARVRGVLLRADDVEQRRGSERRLAPGELELLERDAQTRRG